MKKKTYELPPVLLYIDDLYEIEELFKQYSQTVEFKIEGYSAP
jgi:hypothetical protein